MRISTAIRRRGELMKRIAPRVAAWVRRMVHVETPRSGDFLEDDVITRCAAAGTGANDARADAVSAGRSAYAGRLGGRKSGRAAAALGRHHAFCHRWSYGSAHRGSVQPVDAAAPARFLSRPDRRGQGMVRADCWTGSVARHLPISNCLSVVAFENHRVTVETRL